MITHHQQAFLSGGICPSLAQHIKESRMKWWCVWAWSHSPATINGSAVPPHLSLTEAPKRPQSTARGQDSNEPTALLRFTIGEREMMLRQVWGKRRLQAASRGLTLLTGRFAHLPGSRSLETAGAVQVTSAFLQAGFWMSLVCLSSLLSTNTLYILRWS